MRTGLGLGLAIVLAGCGGEPPPAADPAGNGAEAAQEERQDPASAGSAAAYQEIAVADGGTIRGKVTFAGAPPPPTTVSTGDAAAACGEEVTLRRVRVGREGGLAGAVVSLTDIRRGRPLATLGGTRSLDQRGCAFSPHVLLAPVGAPVTVLNSDPVTHNVHTAAFDNRPVNRSQPAGVAQIEMSFRAPEKVRVSCDMHAWMGAWIVVADHPYHAVTGEDGAFVLEGVPPGTYTLEAWHEELGARATQVTVSPDGEVRVALEMRGGDAP